jgi:hypothetical protein
LDDEEKKLKRMEHELLTANRGKLSKSPSKKHGSDNDILNTSFEMVKSINKSLKMLENVATAHDGESVEVAGYKMNKLWYRLTGVAEEKFHPQEVRRFTKAELAQFYEDAKETVLESDLRILLDTSHKMQLEQEEEHPHSESDNEQVPEKEAIKESPNDTMESIANIETEEEYAGSSYEPEPTPEPTPTDNDDELQQLLANQMRVFVDQKPTPTATAISDETFQVQRKSQGEAPAAAATEQHETNTRDESTSTLMDLEIDDEQSPINTEPIESIDLSAVDDDGSIIPEPISLQITDMDDDDNGDGQMIEDISFPNLEISLNDTAVEEIDYEESRAHDLSTITECTEYEQVSSEPMSSEIVTHTSSTSERGNSEIEQRLLSLSDSLEQVDEAFKKIPMMSVQSSATYSTDRDFIDAKMAREFENFQIESNSDSEILMSVDELNVEQSESR